MPRTGYVVGMVVGDHEIVVVVVHGFGLGGGVLGEEEGSARGEGKGRVESG